MHNEYNRAMTRLGCLVLIDSRFLLRVSVVVVVRKDQNVVIINTLNYSASLYDDCRLLQEVSPTGLFPDKYR